MRLGSAAIIPEKAGAPLFPRTPAFQFTFAGLDPAILLHRKKKDAPVEPGQGGVMNVRT